MDRNRAIEVLERHNKWRRGDDELPQTDPKELTEAIDCVCAALKAQGEPVAWMVELCGVSEFELSEEEAQEAKKAIEAEYDDPDCATITPLYTAPQPESGEWIKADDVERLTRELDVLMNGEDGAAPQASLCDIVGQVRAQGLTIRCVSTNAQAEALEALEGLEEYMAAQCGQGDLETLRRFIESQTAQAVPDGIQRFLKNAFITCETSGFDKCYVVVFKFPTLAEAQDLHRYIVTLPAPAQGGQV